MVTDNFGFEVVPGDVVGYVVRRGSSMYPQYGTVSHISEHYIHLIRFITERVIKYRDLPSGEEIREEDEHPIAIKVAILKDRNILFKMPKGGKVDTLQDVRIKWDFK